MQIPVYVWAPEEEGQFQPGRCSRWWLNRSLASFEADLNAMGSGLVYRRAQDSRTALLQLVEETGAQGIVFNHLYDPISLVRDNEVKSAMHEMQVSFPFLHVLHVIQVFKAQVNIQECMELLQASLSGSTKTLERT